MTSGYTPRTAYHAHPTIPTVDGQAPIASSKHTPAHRLLNDKRCGWARSQLGAELSAGRRERPTNHIWSPAIYIIGEHPTAEPYSPNPPLGPNQTDSRPASRQKHAPVERRQAMALWNIAELLSVMCGWLFVYVRKRNRKPKGHRIRHQMMTL